VTNLLEVPTELRHQIIEYVLTAVAWLHPLDVDALQAADWFSVDPEWPKGASIHQFRYVPNTKNLAPLLLVSKLFAKDTTYV
jgi:hypothetical protein